MLEEARIQTRRVYVDVEKVDALARKMRLDTAEKLAGRCGIDVKTIQAMLRGEGNLKSIVQTVAETLGIPVKDLLPKACAPTSLPVADPSQNPRSRIYRLEFDDTAIGGAEEIIVKIRRSSGGKGLIFIIDDRPGSRIIEVEMSDDDGVLLLTAFIERKLENYGIRSIAVLDSLQTESSEHFHTHRNTPPPSEYDNTISIFQHAPNDWKKSWTNSIDDLFEPSSEIFLASETLATVCGSGDNVSIGDDGDEIGIHAASAWTAGGSQEQVFTGLPSGVSQEVIKYSGVNGTGSLTQVSTNYANGTSSIDFGLPPSLLFTQLFVFAGVDGNGNLSRPIKKEGP